MLLTTPRRLVVIVLIEDDPGDAFLIQEMLIEHNEDASHFMPQHFKTLGPALDYVRNQSVDLVLTDLGLPDSQGLDTLRHILALNSRLPVIVLSSLDDEELAIEAVKAGAQDYLIKKEVDPRSLKRTIRHSLTRKKIEEKLKQRNEELAILFKTSTSMNSLMDLKELFPVVLRNIVELDAFKAEKRGAIFLHSNGQLKLAQSIGYSVAQPAQLQYDIALCRMVEQSGEAVVCRSKIPAGATNDGNQASPLNSIALPLRSKGALMGVVCLHLCKGKRLQPNEFQVLVTLCNQLGTAIDNSMLFQETKKLALHDPLTGLPNRRMMDVILQNTFNNARRYGRAFALIMLDIDHFKQYNDSLGHQAGDELLVKLASVLSQAVRKSDFVARYGGEEFLVCLGEVDLENACEMAERLRKSVRDRLDVTVSLGVAAYAECLTVENIIEKADQALYSAKNKGRNRVERAAPFESASAP